MAEAAHFWRCLELWIQAGAPQSRTATGKKGTEQFYGGAEIEFDVAVAELLLFFHFRSTEKTTVFPLSKSPVPISSSCGHWLPIGVTDLCGFGAWCDFGCAVFTGIRGFFAPMVRKKASPAIRKKWVWRVEDFEKRARRLKKEGESKNNCISCVLYGDEEVGVVRRMLYCGLWESRFMENCLVNWFSN